MRNIKFLWGGIALLVGASVMLSGCGGGGLSKSTSSTTGLKYNQKDGFQRSKETEQETGPGLVLIVGGTMLMGSSENDIGWDMDNRPRQVSIQSFYMDETEVTNNHWREFLWYIQRDSSEELYISLLPDTTVWYRELAYNDPYVETYFGHPAFNDYPVVGINWHQANEYCTWRTQKVNEVRKEKKDLSLPSYRLPTEAEWEYAARGGLEQELYPWMGKSLRKEFAKKGEFRLNFKLGRGDYAGWAPGPLNDKFFICAPVKLKQIPPNDFGLYHMAGNVAEWTKDVYRLVTFEDMDDLNSHRRYGKGQNQRTSDYYGAGSAVDKNGWVNDNTKVFRGGSWKDIAYYCTTGARRYEQADSSRSWIGFRCAMIRVGRPF